MTKEQALAILKQPDRIGCHLIKANDEESNKYNQESIEALNMAIKAIEQNNEEIYKAGYEDGVHDGYYSSLIEDGTEEKHFGKSYQEQPTSDDCVSRQAVFETIDDCNSDGLKGIFCSYNDGERFKEYIKKLPPATSTRKVGKWISEPNCWLRCSCCNSHYPHTSIYAIKGSNYCPNCGADMRGESENG